MAVQEQTPLQEYTANGITKQFDLEFDKFIATVDDPRMHCLFTMLFFTGRRKGEIFALTPDDVKPDKLLISKSVTRQTLDDKPYQITSTKADKVHEIPVSLS